MSDNTPLEVPAYPKYDEVEIDKIPGAWVITYWRPDDITLRLKILHLNSMDPNEFVAEVRLNRYEEFQPVHQFDSCVAYLAPSIELIEGLRETDWPPIWTSEFIAMAHIWGRLGEIAEFGGTAAERYGAEPISSRDQFEIAPVNAEAVVNSDAPKEPRS